MRTDTAAATPRATLRVEADAAAATPGSAPRVEADAAATAPGATVRQHAGWLALIIGLAFAFRLTWVLFSDWQPSFADDAGR